MLEATPAWRGSLAGALADVAQGAGATGAAACVATGGQGVFGIALGRVWREVEAGLVDLPSEHPDGTPGNEGGDELAARRAARRTG